MAFLYSILLALLTTAPAFAGATYIALTPNINDFSRFADGGADGNWYVGFNNAWIVQLPPAPQGFERAYIGARIGRAKTRPNPNKPWLREIIDGKIYMAISQTPSWTSEQSFFLVETNDVSAEAEAGAQTDGVGPAHWFWSEVPLSMVSTQKPNYLIIWSPTQYFVRASSSPILAATAAEGENEAFAWNNHAILGVPPRTADQALETPLKNMHPALAIKLVPGVQSEVTVTDFALDRVGRDSIASFTASGQDIGEAWLEQSRDQLDWSRITKLAWHPPYAFTLTPDKLPPPGSFLRAVARDGLGNTGSSAPIQIPYATK